MTVLPWRDTTLRPAAAAAGPDVTPALTAERMPIAPVEVLPPAAAAEAARLAGMEEANRSFGEPYRNGLSRLLGTPVRVTLDAADLDAARVNLARDGGLLDVTAAGDLVWTARVSVTDAWMLRVHLVDVALPAGSTIWAYGPDHAPQGPIDVDLVSIDAGLWAPSVVGDSVWLEVQVPAAGLQGGTPCGFTLDGVMELFPLDETGRPLTYPAARSGSPVVTPAAATCLMDVSCVSSTPEIENASDGVGRMQFVSGNLSYVCTGGLLNDAGSSGTPYFLTANHCLSSQSEVSSLEVWWDYRTSACGGSPPPLSSVPKSFGGTLLASSPLSDFTFIELNAVPPGRFFFGWSTANPGSATLERVSNPLGGPQVYSTTVSNGGSMGTCAGLSTFNFIYSTMGIGGISGGSSGSPVWMQNDIVVGQLLGTCGPTADECDTANSIVDGWFSSTFNTVAPFLMGQPVPPGAPSGLYGKKIKKTKVKLVWTDNATTEDRFEIVEWTGAVWNPIGSVPANKTKAKVKNLLRGTTYQFGVRACKNAVCSAENAVVLTTR